MKRKTVRKNRASGSDRALQLRGWRLTRVGEAFPGDFLVRPGTRADRVLEVSVHLALFPAFSHPAAWPGPGQFRYVVDRYRPGGFVLADRRPGQDGQFRPPGGRPTR
jgi:hypothetical protein